jgi:hypothetical protein
MSRLKIFVAFACGAAAAWLSLGTVALTDAGPGVDRVALLPLSPLALACALAGGALAATVIRSGAPPLAAAPLALCALPWLPIDVPTAFLIWSGPAALLPWVAVAAILGGTAWRPHPGEWRRPPLLATAVSAAVLSAAAWNVAPVIPGGDEPHYLVITQSLIADRDLRIENNHRQGDYRAYFAGELPPHYIRRGRDGQIYSIHAPGVPALVAPAFALAGYRGVVFFLIAVAALASGLVWHVAWLAAGRRDAAWFAWGAVTFGTTFVFHAFTVYPDGIGGVLVLTGVWAIVRIDAASRPGGRHDDRIWPWALHGAALALLPWLHSRFALLAGTLGAVILLRLWPTPRAVAKGLAFLAVPAASGAAWIAYFAVIYGTASPSAPYGPGDLGSAAFIADGLAGLFFDQRFGLLTYAPVLAFALAGFACLRRRLAIELLLIVVPYLIVVTTFRMWWAGWSAPARFAAPILPLLAVPAAAAWAAISRRGTRTVAIGALVVTVTITALVAGVDHGRLAYNVRQEPSLLIRWLSANADLTSALPAWSGRGAALFRDVGVWTAALLAAWALVRRLDRAARLRAASALAGAATLVVAGAAMAASTIVWSVSRVDNLAPAATQLALLRRAASEPRAVLVGLRPPRALAPGGAARALQIRLALLPAPGAAAAGFAPLAVLPATPAGDYRFRTTLRGTGGRVTIAVGRTSPPIAELPAAGDGSLLRLPVGVTGLVIRADEAARANIRSIAIEPQSLVAPGDRLTPSLAGRAVRYPGAVVFFLDDRSLPEPDGFWIGGARDASVVVAPDQPLGSASQFVTNAPVENRVSIESGAWRSDLTLAPGEQRAIGVPFEPRAGAAAIRFGVSSGFRPSEHDPASKDERYLGVYVKIQ